MNIAADRVASNVRTKAGSLGRVLRHVGAGLVAALALGGTLPAAAQTATTTSTMVRLNTNVGPIDLSLLDTDAPITVANFLLYVRGGDYAASFLHRSVSNFIVQGGGWKWATTTTACCTNVTSRGTINNEFSATRSNVRGTVAMAKVDGSVNSATSQWFINTVDNAANLDVNNGGYSVFARVTPPSMLLVDKIAALKIVNAGSGGTAGTLTAFAELPVTGWTSPNPLQRSNLVVINSVTELGTMATQTDAKRVLTYLEAVYPSYLSPVSLDVGETDGYTYRYYSDSKAYVGIKDGKVWYQVPSISSEIRALGTVTEILATAAAAGY